MRNVMRTAVLAAAMTMLVAACAAAAAPGATTTAPSPVAATAAATLAPAATKPAPSPTPTLVPDTPYGYRPTDGFGDERLVGTWTFYSASPSAVKGHDAVGSFRLDLNDPRVTGEGTFDFGMHTIGEVGPSWGEMVLQGPEGTWKGNCTGAHWRELDPTWSSMISCWLTGSKAYAANSVYLQMLGGPDEPMRVDGIIYPGRIPDPVNGM